MKIVKILSLVVMFFLGNGCFISQVSAGISDIVGHVRGNLAQLFKDKGKEHQEDLDRFSDKLAILSKYKADEAENKTLTPERTSEFEEARKTACDIAWKITVFDAQQYKINFKGEPTEEMKKATEDYVDRLTEYVMYNLLGDEYTAWQKKVKAYGAMFKMTALIVKSAKK